jgi:hypothetical protein
MPNSVRQTLEHVTVSPLLARKALEGTPIDTKSKARELVWLGLASKAKELEDVDELEWRDGTCIVAQQWNIASRSSNIKHWRSLLLFLTSPSTMYTTQPIVRIKATNTAAQFSEMAILALLISQRQSERFDTLQSPILPTTE